jgi:hypothetical protein
MDAAASTFRFNFVLDDAEADVSAPAAATAAAPPLASVDDSGADAAPGREVFPSTTVRLSPSHVRQRAAAC